MISLFEKSVFDKKFQAGFEDPKNRLLLAYLAYFGNLTFNKLKQVAKFYPDFESAVKDKFCILQEQKIKSFAKTISVLDSKSIKSFKLELDKNQSNFVTFFDAGYPKSLVTFLSPPLILYYEGNIKLLSKKEWVTVVGARNSSHYSQIIIPKILQKCCRAGIGVISGMALGVDALAHKVCLENKAKTIGVVGSGLDNQTFYPAQNLALKKRALSEGGLILSEYPPKVSCNKFTFPRRNQILAALSELTWVVEAGIKSGSLITAQYANDLGKQVATTPVSILEKNLAGNLNLLRQGAQIVTQSEDIFRLLNLKFTPNPQTQAELKLPTELEQKIYDNLSLIPISTQDLIEKSKVEFSDMISTLSLMELNGLVKNLDENTWVRTV